LRHSVATKAAARWPPAEPLPEEAAHAAHLLDDVCDADVRAQIVADDRDRNALSVRAARHLTEHRGFERTPPAAVNENGERCLVIVSGQKKIDRLARRTAIGQAQFGAALLEHFGAVELRLACPAGENLRMLGHAGAIVIFSFIVDRGQGRLRSFAR
jgi:hypothetical protein